MISHFLSWNSQSTCFNAPLFTDLPLNHFSSRISNHQSTEIDIRAFFHCLPTNPYSDEIPNVIIPIISAFGYSHSFESPLKILVAFQLLHFAGITLKISIIWRLLRLCNCEWIPSSLAVRQSFRISKIVYPFLQGFHLLSLRILTLSIQIDWSLSFIVSTNKISLLCFCNSFALDCFFLYWHFFYQKIKLVL